MVGRRRPLVLGLLLACALAGVAAVAGCRGETPDPKPSPTAESTDYVTGPTAPDGGELKVVESGFTLPTEGVPSVTFGAIIENTSRTHAAIGISVTATLHDAVGNESRVGLLPNLFSKTVTILPGQRAGAGQEVSAARKDIEGEPVQLKVQLSRIAWRPVSQVLTIAISDVTMDMDSGKPAFSLTVDSQLPDPVNDPHVIIIVRDRAGKVIGGLQPVTPFVAGTPWPAGRSRQRVEVFFRDSVPENADLARTEVFAGFSGWKRE